MFIVLMGPKGSGKSHIGRLLEARFGVQFVDVEPVWLAFNRECRAAGHAPELGEGMKRVRAVLDPALGAHRHVAIETTGAAPLIVDGLLDAWPRADTLIAYVTAPRRVCLARIAARDQATHIPVDQAVIEEIYELSAGVASRADLAIENIDLTDEQLAARFASRLAR